MGLFKQVMVVAALAVTTPAWASGGHDRDRDEDRGGRQYHGRGYDQRPDWRHREHHHRHGDRAPRHAYYSQQYYYAPPTYYAPPPVYGYAAPAPGFHIVAPNIFVPFR